MPVTRNAYQRRDVVRVLSAQPAKRAPTPATEPARACGRCGEPKRPDRAFCSAECANSSRSDICGNSVHMIVEALREPKTFMELRERLGIPPEQRERLRARLATIKSRGRIESVRISDETGSRVMWRAC